MRLLTWNIDYKVPQGGSWDYILGQVRPDLALLQECRRPRGQSPNSSKEQLLLDLIGGRRDWGSAIYTRELELTKVEAMPEMLGWVTAAENRMKDQSILLIVSIHVKLAGVDFVAPGLRVVIEKIRELSKYYDHLIMGGDLNAARSYDLGPSGSVDPQYQHGPIFDLLESDWCNCSLKRIVT